MQFQDELAGGIVLIRPALQSPGFIAGSTGWTIRADGSAEFNNIVIRGGGTSDPLIVGPAGLPQVIIRTTPTNGLIVFPTNRPIEQNAATLNSAVINSGAANERAELQMTGPTVSGATGGVRVILKSQPNNGSGVAQFAVQNRAGTDVYLTADGDEVLVNGRPLSVERAATTDIGARIRVTGEAQPRLTIVGDGALQWGPGTAGPDVNLYRGAADVLQTDDTFVVLGELHPRNLVRGTRALVTDSQYETRVSGESFARWFIRANGETWWGTGAATQDTNLFRDGVASLGTNSQFTTYGANTFTTYSPTVGNGGTVTWTTRTGYYQRVGKMVFVVVYLSVNAAGSGAGIVTVDMPTSVDRTTRQTIHMSTESVGPGGSHVGTGHCLFFISGSGATADRLRVSSNGATNQDLNITGADLLAGGTITIEGWYREA